MAKTKPHRTAKGSHRAQRHGDRKPSATSLPQDSSLLLVEASELLHTGQADLALQPAQQALALLTNAQSSPAETLPALSLLGEIQIELGDAAAALKTFEAAVEQDPNGELPEDLGGGAEKFMWLAQLCETGGRDSIRWYEKGVSVLERSSARGDTDMAEDERRNKKEKLAVALGAMVEVWMTDLSLEPEAEEQCEELISRALHAVQPPSPATLQTLASVRLSQLRAEDARAALSQSLATWKDVPSGHPDTPDFALRISLARLLMEAGMEDEALDVLEGLVGEDDESVEAWYLGGWCLWLMGSQSKGEPEETAQGAGSAQEGRKSLLLSGREWLRNCLKLYHLLDYEDERLREHASGLVETLNAELGSAEIEDLEDDWDTTDSDAHSDEMDTT